MINLIIAEGKSDYSHDKKSDAGIIAARGDR